jgi:hypothetical protein
MASNRIEPRIAEDWLADAARYEAWALRTRWNEELSGKFLRLAAEARAQAAARKA